MFDLFLIAALTVALADDPPSAQDTPPAPAETTDAPAATPADEVSHTDEAAHTRRDQLAVADHVLRDRGLSESTLPRHLFPALVEREADVRELRRRLADMQVQLAALQAQVGDMQDFVLDHDRYGTDFSQYRAVRRQAEQEARRQAALEHRARRELARKQAEAAKTKQATAARIAAPGKALQDRLRDMNFGLIGQDVWSSRSAYAYARVDRPGESMTYNPSPFGHTRVVRESRTELDWTNMTISGSVLNAAQATRNIGIAFAFFDEHGNQVGAETVVVNNARPGVPYPFTQKLAMAATKPFASSTSWVLFADPIPPPAQAQTAAPVSAPPTSP